MSNLFDIRPPDEPNAASTFESLRLVAERHQSLVEAGRTAARWSSVRVTRHGLSLRPQPDIARLPAPDQWYATPDDMVQWPVSSRLGERRTGRSMTNTSPRFGEVSTAIRPPSPSIELRTIRKPSPCLVACRDARLASICPGRDAVAPLSENTRRSASPRRPSDSRTKERGACSATFRNRFTRIRCNRPRFHHPRAP